MQNVSKKARQSGQLESLSTGVEQSETLGQFQNLIELLPLRKSAHSANVELTQLSNRLSSDSAMKKILMFVIAGLMALISFLVTRISEE